MASRIFNDILNNIQSSKLNFCLQLSPYSANISLKKTFLTDRSGNVLLPDNACTAKPSSDDNIAALVSKNLKLEEENSALRKDLENSIDDCREARNQLENLVEKELVKEVKLKEAIKQENFEFENSKVKELEEEIKILENKIDEHMDEIKSLQHANNLVREISNKVNKELNETKLKAKEEKAAILKEHKAEVKSWKRELGKANKENINMKKKLDEEVTKIVTTASKLPDSPPKLSETEVICSICADPIVSFKPKYFLGEAFNPACNKCDDSFDGDNSGPDHEGCQHTPVCVIRQPHPPPSPAVTHLVNEQSKYHEHMMSVRGVPGRYGGCDRCMEAYSKNYGCDDCVWLKWHGKLHGYPDIHPSDFKKYLEPSEWSTVSNPPFGL